MGLDRESVGVRMSLVYNNDKPIGKCESYSIDKIPGTTPFVMLTNYEPLRSELNENQQVVLELLQKAYAKNKWMTPFGAVFSVANENDFAIRAWLTKEEQFKVLAAFADWEMKEVAE